MSSKKNFASLKGVSKFHGSKQSTLSDHVVIKADPVVGVRNVYEALSYTAKGNEECFEKLSKALQQTNEAVYRVFKSGELIPPPTCAVIPKPLSQLRVVLFYSRSEYDEEIPLRWKTLLKPFSNGSEITDVDFNRVPHVLFLHVPLYNMSIDGKIHDQNYIFSRFIEDFILYLFELKPDIVYGFLNTAAVKFLSAHTKMLSFKDKHTVGFKSQPAAENMLKEISQTLSLLEKKRDEREKAAKFAKYYSQILWKHAIL